MTASQQGGKRLMSTLLLFFAAYVGLPPNNTWSPYTLAHQPSHGLAHPKQKQIHKHSREEPGFHHTLTHVKEHRIHAAMLTMHS